MDTLKQKIGLATTSAGSIDTQPTANPNPQPSEAVDRLLNAHKEATEAPVKRGRGRPPGSGRKDIGGAGTQNPTGSSSAPAPSFLPPSTSLSEVMGSATGIFYGTMAALYDDEDWLVTDTVKKEMGNVLSWMLADDFYKVGGIGKYVVGSIMCMGVFATQAAKTGAKRRARAVAKRAAIVNQNAPRVGPGSPNAADKTPTGIKNEEISQRTASGFMASPPQDPRGMAS